MDSEILRQVIPLVGALAFGGLVIFIKLNIDRWKNAKEAENTIQVMNLRAAGQPIIKLYKIDDIEGVPCVKVPTLDGKSEPRIHFLGEEGEFPWIYPVNKNKFVQASVQGIIYYENDAEPLSNVSGMPIISAKLTGNLLQAISMATSSAMQKSQSEDVDNPVVKKKSINPKIVYVGLVLIGMITSINLFIDIRTNSSVTPLQTLQKDLRTYLQSQGK